MNPFLLLVLLMAFFSCETKGQSETRLQVVKDFVQAVQTNDTLKLYEIVDTASLFRVQDKEYLMFETDYMRKRFVSCSVGNIEEKLRIKQTPVYHQDYIISFCGETSNNSTTDSFSLIISFSDYKKNQKIQYFSLEKPIRLIKTHPPLTN